MHDNNFFFSIEWVSYYIYFFLQNVSGRVSAPAENSSSSSPPSVSPKPTQVIPPSSTPFSTPSSTPSEPPAARLAAAIPPQDLPTAAPQPPQPPTQTAPPKSGGSKQRVSDTSVYHGDCIGALPSSINKKINVGAKKQASAAPHQGAIIESMQHHGKGVFSGTFSGKHQKCLYLLNT